MKELANFHQELLDTYGYHLQVGIGINLWHRMLNQQIGAGSTTVSSKISFGQSAPNDPDAKYQYARTFGELSDASAPDGTISVLHRRSVITLIVASWEDEFRNRIAQECGVEKNDLQSDVFHDVNRFRQAILHAGAKLDVEPKALGIFHKGDEIALTGPHMDLIFRALIDELNRIGRVHYGKDPGFNFDNNLNR